MFPYYSHFANTETQAQKFEIIPREVTELRIEKTGIHSQLYPYAMLSSGSKFQQIRKHLEAPTVRWGMCMSYRAHIRIKRAKHAIDTQILSLASIKVITLLPRFP